MFKQILEEEDVLFLKKKNQKDFCAASRL